LAATRMNRNLLSIPCGSSILISLSHPSRFVDRVRPESNVEILWSCCRWINHDESTSENGKGAEKNE